MHHNLYIIAGCNGAGKTTASFEILPDFLDCTEFVNADAIAAALSPFRPESVAFEAGRLMLKRIDDLLDKQVDFAFETTLSARSYIHLIRKAQAKNYKVTLLFFWLQSPELAFERVCTRFANGGHFIPETVVFRRYRRGLRNLFDIYLACCDSVLIYDNTAFKKELIATHKEQNRFKAINPLKLDEMKNLLEESAAFYFDEHAAKIDRAMEHYYQKLIEKTIRENKFLVTEDENGILKRVYADELKLQRSSFPEV